MTSTLHRSRLLIVNDWPLFPCFTGECQQALGMESGEIPDSAITASSSFEDGSVGPRSARWAIFSRDNSLASNKKSCMELFVTCICRSESKEKMEEIERGMEARAVHKKSVATWQCSFKIFKISATIKIRILAILVTFSWIPNDKHFSLIVTWIICNDMKYIQPIEFPQQKENFTSHCHPRD